MKILSSWAHFPHTTLFTLSVSTEASFPGQFSFRCFVSVIFLTMEISYNKFTNCYCKTNYFKISIFSAHSARLAFAKRRQHFFRTEKVIGVVTIEDVILQIHCMYFLSFFPFFHFHTSAFPPSLCKIFLSFMSTFPFW